MEKRNVIAVMGLPQSGKLDAIGYLLAVYRLPKFSFRSVLEEEIRRHNIPIGYMGSREIRKKLEKDLGEEYFPERIIQLICADTAHEDALIEGLELEGPKDFDALKLRFGTSLHTITIHPPITNIFREFLHDARQVMHLEGGGPIMISDQVVVNDGNINRMTATLDAIMLAYGIGKR